MSDSAWRLLATLSDLPSAQSLAEVLAAQGINVRVSSDAGVLGQAAPSRIYVSAAQLERARWLTSAGDLTDAELEELATESPPEDEGERR